MPELDDMIEALQRKGPPQKAYMDRYPTSEDADLARKYDWSYGQPYAGFFTTYGRGPRELTGSPNAAYEGVPYQSKSISKARASDLGIEDIYARAALASNRSALATLGFDPSKTILDTQRDPKNVNVLGLTNTNTDEMYVNAKTPPIVVHEALHRGIDKLKDSPFWSNDFSALEDARNEEMVRALMVQKMGNPEPELMEAGEAGMKEIEEAKKLFSREHSQFMYPRSVANKQKVLDDMEAAAAKYIAARQPRGPR